MNKIFLGGTCNNSTWRDKLEQKVTTPMFNPIVEDWTEEAQEIEKQEKEECNIHLYVITHLMTGVFSIAEVIDSVHDKSKTTILQVMPRGFKEFQLKSLDAVIELVQLRGGIAYSDDTLTQTIDLLNNLNTKEEV